MDVKAFKKNYPCDTTYKDVKEKIQKLEKSIKFFQQFQATIILTKERYN